MIHGGIFAGTQTSHFLSKQLRMGLLGHRVGVQETLQEGTSLLTRAAYLF